jgi:hypothetical protein
MTLGLIVSMGVMIIRFYSTLNEPLTPTDPYIFVTINGTEIKPFLLVPNDPEGSLLVTL